jgi:hypothetical protein
MAERKHKKLSTQENISNSGFALAALAVMGLKSLLL